MTAVMRAVARRVLAENLQVKRGENVTIETWSATLPWANAVVLEAFRLEARPMLLLVDEPTYWQAVDSLPPNVLGRVGSHEWAALRETDAYVFFFGPQDSVREAAVPPSRYGSLVAYEDEWFRIIEKHGVRTVRLDLGRIAPAAARRYHLDVDEWWKETIDALQVDPAVLHREGQRVGAALQRGRSLHITHPNGTDLELRLKGRRPRIHDGLVDRKDVQAGEVFEMLPSGWVAVAPDERFADGEFNSNVPSSAGASGGESTHPVPVRGGRWRFRDGRLDRFTYESGGEEFGKLYRRLGQGKERPGAVNIGLNPKIRTLPGMEDQRRGRVTFMIGRNSYLDGATQTPYFHGYLVLDGADVQVDGRWLVRSGEIV